MDYVCDPARNALGAVYEADTWAENLGQLGFEQREMRASQNGFFYKALFTEIWSYCAG